MNSFSGSSGFIVVSDAAGTRIAPGNNNPFWAIITSNVGGVYGYYEVATAENGTFTIDLMRRSGTQNLEPAYEVTGNVNVPIGAIVWMRRGHRGGNTSIPLYVKQEWNFFYPNPTATPDASNLYAQLTNVTTTGGILCYSWLEQNLLENMTWSNGSLTGTENAREFNNNNITIGSYVHLFEAYGSGASATIAYQQLGNGTVSTIQTVAVDATGGTFTLTFNNGTTAATTGGIAFNATTADVETALEGLSNIVNCTVTGGVSDYTVEFNDSFALYPLMTYENFLQGTTRYVFNSDIGNGSTPGTVTTNYLTVNCETVLYGSFIGNATTWEFNNNQSWAFYGITAWLFDVDVNRTYNGTVAEAYNANLTLNFSGAFGLTLCGNVSICSNKTLTLPHIIGNNTLGKLRITSNATANTTLPTAIRVDNASLEMTMISTPPTPDNGTRGIYFDANGSLMGIDSNGTTYSLTNTGNGTSNGSMGWVQYADGNGGFSATADITIDAANGTLLAESLKLTGYVGNYYILYVDPTSGVQIVSPISPTYVLFADSNGLPTGHEDITFNSTTGTLYTQTIQVGSGGAGDVVTYLDNNGVLQFLANPGAGNFTLHCVNGTLIWI